MYRGTTPTFTFTLPIDCGTISLLSIAFMQGSNLVAERSLQEVTIAGNDISCTLTEEETLRMKASTVKIQLRVGVGSTRLASQVFTVQAEQILKDGVLQ